MKTDPLNWMTTVMTTAPLKITCVNGTPVTEPKPPDAGFVTIPSISVKVGSDKQLTVQGTGFTAGLLCCALVRHGMSKREKPGETIWRVTRFVNSTSKDGSWTVKFDVQDRACYLLSCHSFKDGDARNENAYVEVKIAHVSASPHPRLAFTNHGFSATVIGAQGTVLNANNPVSCTLTPIDCSTGIATGGPVQNAGATFTNPPTNTIWQVEFFPPPPTRYSGCYLLEAAAASEGTISTSGQVV